LIIKLGKPEKIESFWAIEASQLYAQLHSSASGLSENFAQSILKNAGKQKTESYFKKDLRIFLSQYKSPVLLLLIGAVILSVFLGDTSDAVIIALILLSSGVVSFFQESNAGRVVEKLESMITIRSQVLRDGIEKDILASQVVPGDVIVFNAGDMVPADCLLFEANELHVNESSLTGESFPVRKIAGLAEEKTILSKRINCLWEGTNIITGNAKALAINTGSNTVFGTVVKSAETITETSFEKGLKEFGFMLMRITLVLSVLILVVNLLNHKAVIDSALFALALAVGIAPELLPAITTMAMSAGAKQLLNKKSDR
jgi:P-type Mg2+ transporter